MLFAHSDVSIVAKKRNNNTFILIYDFIRNYTHVFIDVNTLQRKKLL